jgi:hypothetical protein
VLWESCFFLFLFFDFVLFFLLFGSASKYGTISIDFLFLFLLHPLECKFGCQARAEQYLTLMSVVFFEFLSGVHPTKWESMNNDCSFIAEMK